MKVKFKHWDCKINIREYNNGRKALQLVDAKTAEPIATATVNVPDAILEDNEILIKDYSENTGMLNALVEAGIVTDTGKRIQSGFVNIPVCIFIPE
jgi:hypothetical protein